MTYLMGLIWKPLGSEEEMLLKLENIKTTSSVLTGKVKYLTSYCNQDTVVSLGYCVEGKYQERIY